MVRWVLVKEVHFDVAPFSFMRWLSLCTDDDFNFQPTIIVFTTFLSQLNDFAVNTIEI